MRKLLVALLLTLAACSSKQRGPEAEPAPYAVTSVVVENQDVQQYRVYIVNDVGLEYRLGIVDGNSVTEFRIPENYARSGQSVRFVTVPIASRNPPTTQRIVLNAGDQITIRITP